MTWDTWTGGVPLMPGEASCCGVHPPSISKGPTTRGDVPQIPPGAGVSLWTERPSEPADRTGLVPQRQHEGGQSGGVVDVLHPRQVGAPGGQSPGCHPPGDVLQVLVPSACPLVCDSTLTGGPQCPAEGPPPLRAERWTSAGHHVSQDPMEAGHVPDQELPCPGSFGRGMRSAVLGRPWSGRPEDHHRGPVG